ncbi:centrin 3 [Mycena olivaceomarginata]|nr:centrin 3 [Mycena olivaceomarginata]
MPAVQKGRRRNSSPRNMGAIKEAFELFDKNKDGAVDYHELKAAMLSMGGLLLSLGFDLGKAEVLKILRDHGKSGEGLMNFENFAKIMSERILARNPMDEIRRAFQLFDKDGAGKISFRDLRHVADDLNEPIDDDELKSMIEEFDLDHDGKINEQEFLAIMAQQSGKLCSLE